MNISLTYNNFINLFRDYCKYNLTKDEWYVIYDFFAEMTVSKYMSFDDIADCLEWYMDDLAFLFGDFETWDDYMENRRKNDGISH